MEKIALTSTGPLSGKTTLAAELEKLGYAVANHSLTITNLFVKYTQECCYPGFSLQELYDDKEFWRPLLQKFGDDILFTSHPRYIDMTLEPVKQEKQIVLEAVRSNQQAEQLRVFGFAIVQLHIPEYIRQERAGSAEAYHKIVQSMTHKIEQPIDRSLVDLRVLGTQNPELLASHLKGYSLAELKRIPLTDRGR